MFYCPKSSCSKFSNHFAVTIMSLNLVLQRFLSYLHDRPIEQKKRRSIKRVVLDALAVCE